MSRRRAQNPVAARLHENDRMRLLVDRQPAIEIVDPAPDCWIGGVRIDVVVGQRLHRLKPPERAPVLPDRQDQPLIVVLMTGPDHAIVGVILRVERVIDQEPVRRGFHRGIVDIRLEVPFSRLSQLLSPSKSPSKSNRVGMSALGVYQVSWASIGA